MIGLEIGDVMVYNSGDSRCHSHREGVRAKARSFMQMRARSTSEGGYACAEALY